jgi:hypothetical protein
MTEAPLVAERAHLASLLEAIQRCVYFLAASRKKQRWPLSGAALAAQAKDVGSSNLFPPSTSVSASCRTPLGR